MDTLSSSPYHDIRSVFFPAYRGTREIQSVQIGGFAIVSEAHHVPVTNPVHCPHAASLGLNDGSQATREQSACHRSLQKYDNKWMSIEVPCIEKSGQLRLARNSIYLRVKYAEIYITL